MYLIVRVVLYINSFLLLCYAALHSTAISVFGLIFKVQRLCLKVMVKTLLINPVLDAFTKKGKRDDVKGVNYMQNISEHERVLWPFLNAVRKYSHNFR